MTTPTATIFVPYHALDEVHQRGTRAAQPVASAVVAGTLYYVTDESVLERSDGTSWASYAGTGGGGAPAPHHTTHETGGTDAIAALSGAVITSGTVAAARLGAHHVTHEPGGSDALAALDGSVLTTGTVPDARLSTNIVRTTDARLSDPRTPTPHATTHKAGGSDVLALDTLGAPTDITTLNASAVTHGLLPKLSNVATQFLNGQGAWTAPAGGGNVTGPASSVANDLATYADGTGKVLQDSGVPVTALARRDQANVFTNHDQQIAAASPAWAFIDTAQPANGQRWDTTATGGQFAIRAVNDLDATLATPLLLQRNGDVTVGAVLIATGGFGNTPLNATNLLGGTVPDARLSTNVALLNSANVFTQDQTIQNAAPRLLLMETDQAANNKLWNIRADQLTLRLAALTDAGGEIGLASISRAGDLYLSGAPTERGRVSAMGQWVAIAFNAANFTASTGAWTVTAGQVLGASYQLVGKTCTLSLYVYGSSLSAAAPYLSFVLPPGLTVAAGNNYAVGCPYMNISTVATGIAQVAPSSSTSLIFLYRDIGASQNWQAGIVSVAFTLPFQIL